MVEEKKKIRDRWDSGIKRRDYQSKMALENARSWMRYRSRMIRGMKANRSSENFLDMSCRLCKSGKEEDQTHLEDCEGTKNERRELKN